MLTFRTIDGSGNNLGDPTFNSTGSDMVRIAPANFAPDTTDTPIDGPNPREISNVVSSGPQAEASRSHRAVRDGCMCGASLSTTTSITRFPMASTPIDITIPPGDPNLPDGTRFR